MDALYFTETSVDFYRTTGDTAQRIVHISRKQLAVAKPANILKLTIMSHDHEPCIGSLIMNGSLRVRYIGTYYKIIIIHL
jgi:hypothetical protein